MPLTERVTSRKVCHGPPKQGYAEKRKKQKKAAYVIALKFNPNHSHEDGQFISGPGGSGSDSEGKQKSARVGGRRGSSLTPSQRSMQAVLARQSRKKIHQVKTAEEAVALVLKGERVEIQDTKDVHTLLEKLGEMAIRAKELKEKAPNFDPCLITVKHVSLFCTEKLKTKEFPHGIPRIEMPQFKSKTPIPGTEADKLPRDENGEVDASKMFLTHLQELGIKANPEGKVLARKLKASQAEMEGAKVAGMMLGERDPKTAGIWVSKDGYVIDGHHTWAAAIGRDAEDGNLDNDKEMNVTIVDMNMADIYHLSVEWTRKFGLPGHGVKKSDILRLTCCHC